MTAVRVVGIGQELGGDDGVGPLVIRRLSAAPPPRAELVIAREPSDLVRWLQYGGEVVVVDAVVDPPRSGHVRVVELDELDTTPPSSVSSHGLGVVQAVGLCKTLYPGTIAPSIVLLAIAVESAKRYGARLSPAAEEAVDRAERWIRVRAES